MWNDNDFKGRVAVVTGGSDGLGFDFCRGLIEAGCTVYFCGRSVERGRHAEEKLGERARFVATDVCDAAQIQDLAREVGRLAGRVDYLVNNVANDDRIAFDTLTEEDCDMMWRTNLRPAILVTKAFLDLLRAGAGKAIVNIGTTNYMLGLSPFTTYNATKSGLVGFTRSLAHEIGPEGIRANMVCPGWVMTGKQLEKHVTEADKRELIEVQALKFLLEPEHITPAVMFLLSSGAAAITGQILVVDAGKVMY
ncbi:MAG: SDR family NAD(P)-dependent oxidoreductase [Capsulimonadaceae bacterium]|nr:SDR family NAD(P)-dependent oxidoreductase [Capsulimonadaceae bacterium]